MEGGADRGRRYDMEKGYGTGMFRTVVFFFQAEDGIRDHCVTGVQTCALPICRAVRAQLQTTGHIAVADQGLVFTQSLAGNIGLVREIPATAIVSGPDANTSDTHPQFTLEIGRASCRKECRSRWSPYQ